jgi:hypothetical protein
MTNGKVFAYCDAIETKRIDVTVAGFGKLTVKNFTNELLR